MLGNQKFKIANCQLPIANWWKPIRSFFNLQFSICNLQLAMAFVLVLLLPELALANEAFFPRGPGFYFNIVKFFLVAGVYLSWVQICSWVNRDAQQFNLNTSTWNPLLFGAGLLGLMAIWN